jgi:hypothetical protein
MERTKFFKTIAVVGLIFLGVLALSSHAFGWGAATHAYIDSHLNEKDSLNAIYGGMVPDMFQYAFDNPCLSVELSDQTHHSFMPAWDEASVLPSVPPKALAYGFVSHNDTWGADSTAHRAGITFGQSQGYIIAKAHELKTILEQVPEYQSLQIPDSISLEISHELVEDGVDILVKRLDPTIGQKLMMSAMGRSKALPVLLAEAYAADLSSCLDISYLEASRLITSTEADFRKNMVAYGALLRQDETTAVQLLSQQVTELAAGFLAANGIEVPPGTDLTLLIEFAITTSMEICGDDFGAEIQATIALVKDNLISLGVSY